MHHRSCVGSLVLFFLPSAAWGQHAGEVLRYQKISAAEGGAPRGIKTNDQFGRGAAVLGDVDGDGVSDLAVGALGDDDNLGIGMLDYGACWILFMNRDGTVKDHYKISRSSAGLPLDKGDEFGRAVRELGDWDLDGVPDVMVGANYDDDNGSNKGAFYLLFLNRDGSVKAWRKVSELSGGFGGDLDNDDQFGRGIRLLGDLDLDGVPEIGVGAIRDDDGGNNRGAYWILFMNRDGTVRRWSKLSETQGNFQSRLSDSGEFGFDACVIGDRNGDGIQDIAIAAPDQKTDGLQQGAVFVVYLDRDGLAKADFRIAENHAGFAGNMLDFNDEFGCAVDLLGDLDGDGFGDLVVGAGKDDDGPPGTSDCGALYVLFLNQDATVKTWKKISRTTSLPLRNAIDSGDRFGTSLAAPGDLDGDGILDLFVGARFDDDGGSGAGCEYFLALNDGRWTPPTAQFDYDPRRGKAPHEVRFTDRSTGDVTAWEWDFGDGATSSERHPSHVYVASGFQTVTLTVRGPAGAHSRTLQRIIKVDPPELPRAEFEAFGTFGFGPLGVRFEDRSTGLVTSRMWDFGDGATSAERDPTHVYTTPGRYTVTLTAQNEAGADVRVRDGLVVVTDVPPPTAQFASGVAVGPAPLTVPFVDASTGSITDRRWEFGDGGESALASPEHTYTAPGTYTVRLTVAGPGGSDEETKPALVHVLPPAPPIADFALDRVEGIDPLTVAFSDRSHGAVTEWTWSFGDGGSSRLRDPVHTYVAPGTYTVALTVVGPGGTHQVVRADLVRVVTVRRGLADPSFEEQVPGGMPGGAWRPIAGDGHTVEAGGSPADPAFAWSGAQRLRLSSAGTAFASPATVPHGPGLAPQGGAGVSQELYLDDPLSVLEFDVAFLPAPGGAAWASVDVSDGALSANLFHADGATPAPLASASGAPMTEVRRVRADLRALFPGSERNTRFVLTLQVGNAGEDGPPSFALLDGFRLEQAPGTVLRYGCDPLVRGSLTVLSGAPRVGTTVVLGAVNPLATQAPGSRAYAWLSLGAAPGHPCGTQLPGFGMAGPGALGEILVDRRPGVLLGSFPGGVWTPGAPAPLTLSMPADAAWIGTALHVQAYLIDPRATHGVRAGVTDALRLVVGP